MIRACATPGCSTLTFGEICLGCMQRRARERTAVDIHADAHESDDAARTETATVTA